MTIFDVIRYSISLPPTEPELRALPDAVYAQWAQYTFGTRETSTYTASGTLTRLFNDDRDIVIRAVEELRASIRRME